MTDSVPEKLGKYKIIEEVGRGGFAAVYKAVDTTLDRTVALKVLAPHLLWDPTFVQRFQREAKVAANLDHVNIVTIYEVSQVEGVYFIAMQFLEGRTLGQILEAEGPWPVSRVQAVIEQIASALDYAHARGFVHRDIKPSNVIVANDGRATLTDFGLVKAGEGTKLSTTGVVFGTPEYMSPEQAEGKELDARSDVYSLGVVLFEMLAGQAPFVADTTPAVMYKHVHEPPPLDELPSDLPQGVVAVVEKALAKKRGDRFASAGEMAAALQQAVSGAVVEEVEVPPEPALHLSLTLKLSVKPQTVDVGGEAKWTVTLRNDGDDDLRLVTVRHGRTLLDEPFDLAAGKGRRFTFTTTYKTEGKKTEKVTATGIASTGESVRDETRTTVQVAPVPPVVKKPVAEKAVPPLRPAAEVKEKARLPTVSRAPRAVPKKTLGVGALLAGGLVLLTIVGIIIFVVSLWPPAIPTEAPPPPTEAPPAAPTEAPSAAVTVEDEWGVVTVAAGDPIKIGFAAGLSGAGIDVLGIDEQRGAELALKDKPEILGFPVELQVEDAQCNHEGGQTVATKLVADPQIVAVLGHMCSSSCLPASKVYEQNNYTMVSPSCTAPSLTNPDLDGTTAFFRTCWNDKIQGPAAAGFVYETLGVTKVATIHDGSPYAEQLGQEFTKGFEELGGEVVAAEAVHVGDTDMRPMLVTRIKAAEPELIYFSAFVAEGGFLRSQMADVGMEEVVFMGADGILADEFIKAAGDASEGVYASAGNPPGAGPDMPAFLEAYEAEYGEAPIAPFHAQAYDAYMVIANAIEQVGVVDADGNLWIGRKALNEAIRGTIGYKGLTGTITCDKYGDCGSGSVAIYMVKDGQWVTAGP